MQIQNTSKESWAYLKSFLAIVLLVLCFWASQWQYHRGVDRHARNTVISERVIQTQIPLIEVVNNPENSEWRRVITTGVFDPTQQILLRNRYFEGKYGFEVLTLFTAVSGEQFWVDRGWVQAGATALTPPVVTPVPMGNVLITGRLRLDSSLPRGSFFALPGNGEALIRKLNAQNQVKTQDFYLDLLSGSTPELTPIVTATLPELSDGPHMAYALQWIFFGGLIIYGRYLIRRTR